MSVIKEAIKNKGLKTTFVAEKIGVSRQGLYNIMNKKAEPTLQQITELSKLLGLTKLQIINDYIK